MGVRAIGQSPLRKGEGTGPLRSYFDGLPPQADLWQGERLAILPMYKSR